MVFVSLNFPTIRIIIIVGHIFLMGSIQSCSSTKPTIDQSIKLTSKNTSSTLQSSPPIPIIHLHNGVDVSAYSGIIEWKKLINEGHSFAFVKATEGITLKDPSFDQHWQDMQHTGIIRGAYHFYVTEDDPHKQAEFFINTVKLKPGDLAPVVDIELIGKHTNLTELTNNLKTWLNLIEKHYSVKPIIYTTAKFWNKHFTNQFGIYPLWIAEYEVTEPNLPMGWSTWHLWQWKGNAKISGIEKSADLSRVNLNGIDLSELIIPN